MRFADSTTETNAASVEDAKTNTSHERLRATMTNERPPELIPEPLREELQPYVTKTSWGELMVHHPYVIDIGIVFEQDGEIMVLPHTNTMFEHKAEAIEEARDEGKWFQYLWLHERPYRLRAFMDVSYLMSDEEYWEVLREMWMDTENLHEWGDDRIRDLFDCDGRELFMEEGDRWEWAQVEPTAEGEMIIYRGYSHPDAERGWSWTLDLNRARWFARRFADVTGGSPAVVTARVQKDDVLGYLNGRVEYEVVADPEKLRITGREQLKDE